MPSYCYASRPVRAILLCCLTLAYVPFSHSLEYSQKELGSPDFSSPYSSTPETGNSPFTYQYHPAPGDIENQLPLGDEALQQALEDVQKALKEREIEHGPYHLSIAENLLTLAKIYVAQKEYEQARDVINRALEVQRISAGLYGTGQIPIVERLILVNRVLENWQDVDKNYEFLYWLYRRAYGENAPELMPLLRYYTDWKIEVLNRGLFTSRLPFIKTALRAAKRANVIISNTPELEEMGPYFMNLESSLKEANKIESAQNRPNF